LFKFRVFFVADENGFVKSLRNRGRWWCKRKKGLLITRHCCYCIVGCDKDCGGKRECVFRENNKNVKEKEEKCF
jgi:hypothetical protein